MTLSAIASELLLALEERRQIAPLTGRPAGLKVGEAYRITAAVRRAREARGERVVGRKIGFTNTTIWDEYGVHAPIWGYVYDSTVHSLGDLSHGFSLGPLVEPRIEPEIVFGLARAPESGMDEPALLSCLAWIAHGFEIVQSLFPCWRFQAADTIAAFGLHGALLLGPKLVLPPTDRHFWLERLSSFGIALRRNGEDMDHGHAKSVLGGGPLLALRHLAVVLASDPDAPPLAAGELVSTGTLTRAFPVAPGESWSTHLDGLPIAGISVSLG